LQAFVQWRYLKKKIDISKWWVATPMLAILPMLLVGSSTMTCDICRSLRLFPSGAADIIFGAYDKPSIEIHAFISFSGYLFLLGLFQWFLLRRKLNFSIGWIFTPGINAITLFSSRFLIGLFFLSGRLFDFFPQPLTQTLMIPYVVLMILDWVLMLEVAFGMQDIISALVISRILRANDIDKQKLAPMISP